MLYNLHTHTFRCHHASGTEKEYIENAIISGIKVLGFSEHVPCPFHDGHESSFRLFKKDTEDYFTALRSLKLEYAGKIDIHIGFECEYYPKYFYDVLDFVSPYEPEYLILGQHFTMNEEDGVYSMHPTSDENTIKNYSEEVCEGILTGRFTYVAHPDVINYTGDDAIYAKYMRKICETAKSAGVPLEYNFLGQTGRRIYPSGRFFSIAADVGYDIVLGCDAHNPAAMLCTETEKEARRFLASHGITPKDEIEINYLKW